MKTRIGTAIAAGLLAVTAVAAPAAAAPAEEEWCPEDAVCFWQSPGFNGATSIRFNPGQDCDPAPNGVIGSLINNAERAIVLFDDPDCETGYLVVASGNSVEYGEWYGWV